MNHHSGSESDQKDPTKSKSEESSSTSFSTGARPKRTAKEETSTSGVRASMRRKFKSSNAAEGGTIGNKKNLLSSIDKENLSAEKQEEFPTSDSSEASDDVTEDCIQLSDSIWIFPDRRISTHGEIYEGELRSGICDAVPIVLKLVENTPQNMTEARILAKLNNHSHVLSLIHAGTFNFRFVDQIYIALDKCHHENLRELVTNRKEQGFAFNLSRAIEIAGQMVDGVKYIHDNRIIHKDIKPDNILFSPNLRLIKIADFGLSQEIESTSTEVFEKGQFGTNGFRPPESFGGGIISQKSDIFSLGVTLYFVLSNGEHPFGKDQAGLNYHMQNGEIDFTGLPNIRNLKTTDHLIKSMIKHKLNHRPTIWQVSEHPFWTGKEVSCDFDYHCPESSSSLIPSIPEETSHSMDWHLVLEHIKRIELRNKAAPTKSQQRVKGSDEDPTSSETDPDLAAEGTKVQVKLGTQYGALQISDDLFMYSNQPLQEGTYVYKGYQLHASGDRRPLAIKCIVPCEDSHLREVQHLLTLASHPNVVQIIQSKEHGGYVRVLFIAMELCSSHNLQNYLDRNRENKTPFDFDQTMSFTKQLVSGMKHIHLNKIVHRALKPENILLSEDGEHVKVSDFGLSKRLRLGKSQTRQTKLGVGTDGYRAPETFASETIGSSADIFSLGATMYSMWSNGKHPFGEDADSWNYKIKNNEGRDLSGLLVSGTKKNQLHNLIDCMLHPDPKKRPTIEQVAQHPFFKS